MLTSVTVTQDTASPMVTRLQWELMSGMKEAWHKVGQAAVQSVYHNFEVGGRPTWVPLSPITVRIKGHDRPLIHTGRLMNATGYRVIAGGVELYNNVPYGAVHQFGEGNIPARPWMVMQPMDELNFVRIFEAYIQQRMLGG